MSHLGNDGCNGFRPRQADCRGADPPGARLDRIGCLDCGRWFVVDDGPAMLAALEGGCPRCGGTFALLDQVTERAEPREPTA